MISKKPSVAVIIITTAFLCIAWGSTWVFIKIGLQDMPPFYSAGLRFLVGFAVMATIIRFRGISQKLKKKDHLLLFTTGFFGFAVAYGVVYSVEEHISAGLTSILFAAHPCFVAILAHFFIKSEKLDLRKVSGIILGFAGITIIYADDFQLASSSALWAAVIVLVSPFCAAIVAVTVKKYGEHLHPLTLNFLPMLYGMIFLFSGGILFENAADIKFTLLSTVTVIYLAVFGTVLTFIAYYWLLKHVDVSRISFIAYITPLVTVVLGIVILDESFTPQVLAGSGLVLFGTAFATWRRSYEY